jgi:hypothetical protein
MIVPWLHVDQLAAVAVALDESGWSVGPNAEELLESLSGRQLLTLGGQHRFVPPASERLRATTDPRSYGTPVAGAVGADGLQEALDELRVRGELEISFATLKHRHHNIGAVLRELTHVAVDGTRLRWVPGVGPSPSADDGVCGPRADRDSGTDLQSSEARAWSGTRQGTDSNIPVNSPLRGKEDRPPTAGGEGRRKQGSESVGVEIQLPSDARREAPLVNEQGRPRKPAAETVVDRRSRARTAAEVHAVACHAVKVVTAILAERGWSVQDVGATRSYDLHCSHATRDDHYVEVKGTTGPRASVMLTANEVALAQEQYPHTALFVVHQIELGGTPTYLQATGGIVYEVDPWLPDPSRLTPSVYRYSVAQEVRTTPGLSSAG